MRASTGALGARDVYFAANHQAAQVVVAIMLGCNVGDLVLNHPPEPRSWGLQDAPQADIEAICAAGYAAETRMGRLPEKAWPNAIEDRALMAFLHAERTGLQLEPEALEQRFHAAADSAKAILEHPVGQAAIERVAAALGDLYLSGRTTLSSEDVRALVKGIL